MAEEEHDGRVHMLLMVTSMMYSLPGRRVPVISHECIYWADRTLSVIASFYEHRGPTFLDSLEHLSLTNMHLTKFLLRWWLLACSYLEHSLVLP